MRLHSKQILKLKLYIIDKENKSLVLCLKQYYIINRKEYRYEDTNKFLFIRERPKENQKTSRTLRRQKRIGAYPNINPRRNRKSEKI